MLSRLFNSMRSFLPALFLAGYLGLLITPDPTPLVFPHSKIDEYVFLMENSPADCVALLQEKPEYPYLVAWQWDLLLLQAPTISIGKFLSPFLESIHSRPEMRYKYPYQAKVIIDNFGYIDDNINAKNLYKKVAAYLESEDDDSKIDSVYVLVDGLNLIILIIISNFNLPVIGQSLSVIPVTALVALDRVVDTLLLQSEVIQRLLVTIFLILSLQPPARREVSQFALHQSKSRGGSSDGAPAPTSAFLLCLSAGCWLGAPEGSG